MTRMAEIERRIFACMGEARGEFSLALLDIPDNITAPIIGEANFRRYCLPLYKELVALARRPGTCVAVHADGDLRPLWRAIGESGINALDSFSPPPDNDTTAAEAVAQWPEMRLLVNFPSSVHLAEDRGVYAKAMEILQQAGHSRRLWIQISENVPKDAWRRSFPAIIRALRDFGTP